MERYEGENLGAVKGILLIALGDITIPPGTVLLFSAITVASGKSWTEVPFTPESGFYSDSRKKSKAGDFYEKEVKFSIPKVRNEISEEISQLSGKRLAGLVTDMNDETRLVYPLRIEYSAEVPAQAAGYNGYYFDLRGQNTTESPTVTMPE